MAPETSPSPAATPAVTPENGPTDAATATAVPLPPAVAAALDKIEAIVGRERGLGTTDPTRRLITEQELALYIEAEFEEEDEAELRDWQRLMVLFGVLGPSDDLVALYKRQLAQGVAGFFEPETGELYIVSEGGGVGLLEEYTHAHEYTHALQQARFDLKALQDAIEVGDSRSDAEAAFLALLEGDADLMQALYAQEHMDLRALQRVVNEKVDEQDEVPYVLEASILFPYVAGRDFAIALYRNGGGWKGVDEAYASLPSSTEQVLHPEKYFSGEGPLRVDLPDVLAALPQGWQEVDSDVSGEQGWRVMLGAVLGEEAAADAAAGWGGDRYIFLEGPDGALLYVESQRWDSAREAAEFASAYQEFLAAQDAEALPATPGGARGRANGGVQDLRVQGDLALLIVSTDASLLDRVASLFPAFAR